MNGLKANSDIIQTIRNRVERTKKEKRKYMNLQTDNDMKRVLYFFPNVTVRQHKRTSTIYCH